jgi:hypothetical protein
MAVMESSAKIRPLTAALAGGAAGLLILGVASIPFHRQEKLGSGAYFSEAIISLVLGTTAGLFCWSVRRGWIRFSLRWLFLITTLIGCYVGYYANWISRRDAVLKEVEVDDLRHIAVGRTGPQYVPWQLKIFGENRGICDIQTNLQESDPLLREFKSVFPGTHVDTGGNWQRNGEWVNPWPYELLPPLGPTGRGPNGVPIAPEADE